MTDAIKDQNYINTGLAENKNGSRETVRISVNPTTKRLRLVRGAVSVNSGINFAARDQNRVPVLMGVSSVDGKTPVPIYADENGCILI